MAGLAAAPKTANRFDREKLAPLPSSISAMLFALLHDVAL